MPWFKMVDFNQFSVVSRDINWSSRVKSLECVSRWTRILSARQVDYVLCPYTIVEATSAIRSRTLVRGFCYIGFASYLRSHKSSMFYYLLFYYLKIRQISSIYFNVITSVISFINEAKIVVLIIIIFIKFSW